MVRSQRLMLATRSFSETMPETKSPKIARRSAESHEIPRFLSLMSQDDFLSEWVASYVPSEVDKSDETGTVH
jgi:hypothetical protein